MTAGPYRLVRHPGYLGSLALVTALVLALPVFISALTTFRRRRSAASSKESNLSHSSRFMAAGGRRTFSQTQKQPLRDLRLGQPHARIGRNRAKRAEIDSCRRNRMIEIGKGKVGRPLPVTAM